MSYVRYKTVHFGSGKAGLATVGYRLYHADGTPAGDRIATGIQSLGDGQYGSTILFPENFRGRLTWDTGEPVPVTVSEEINPEGASEFLDVRVSTAMRGEGAYAIRLILEDDQVPPQRIAGAVVLVRNASETALLARGETDAQGELTVNLDPGSYRVLVRTTPAFMPLPPQPLEVSGSATVTYTLARFVVEPPAAPGLCRVFGWLRKADGSPAAEVAVAFELAARGAIRADGATVLVRAVTVTTTTDGYFEADLTRSNRLAPLDSGDTTAYVVRCREARLSHRLGVPDQPSVDFATLPLTPV